MTTTLIFGTDPQEAAKEWQEDGVEPRYGSVENDLMVLAWEVYEDPAAEFKEEGLYDRFRDVVHSNRITGTFYRMPDGDEVYEFLQPEDIIDYRKTMTRWYPREEIVKGVEHLKFTCKDAPGLIITKDEVVLGECQLKVICRSGDQIEVAFN